MDDILPIINDIGILSSMKAWCLKNFSKKNLREETYVLGKCIDTDRSRSYLDYPVYIAIIVKRSRKEKSKIGFIPLRHSIQISKKHSSKTFKDIESMKKIIYASMIGSIMYVMLWTKLDMAVL